jgi:hypothetical protein
MFSQNRGNPWLDVLPTASWRICVIFSFFACSSASASWRKNGEIPRVMALWMEKMLINHWILGYPWVSHF